ncbi:MAG: adenylate/guanylate cyclase domain-containing protein [Pseudomonadota bacterium]
MIGRLRLWTGLFLLVFVICHLVNHVLGIVSLSAMEAGLQVFAVVWSNMPMITLLTVVLLVHFGLALYSLYRRRTLRMSGWELWQVALGMAVPFLLVEHLIGTIGAQVGQDVRLSYTIVLVAFWVFAPWLIVVQLALVIVAWVHGAIGLHFWLRLKPWYPALARPLSIIAILLPALSIAGFISAGAEVMRLSAEPGWVTDQLAIAQVTPEVGQTIAGWINTGYLVVIALYLLVLIARAVRIFVEKRSRRPRLTYSSGQRVEIEPGATVLETSRRHGIPHASVCGGRGRCSTCRVRVGAGAENLVPADEGEQRVLNRIGAPPGVRLACQLRPTNDLQVAPLLPAQTGADAVYRPQAVLQGQERTIAILFADMRGFTSLSEGRLPYDTVFVLNRYFESMGQAVEDAGGMLDKFIGDGVMALFGVNRGGEAGSRQALQAVRAMNANLVQLNESLAADLPAPMRIAVGIHVGPVIVGELGFGKAKSFTAIGDAVNTASRLEGLAKSNNVQLVVSDAVAEAASIDLDNFPREEASVKGKSDLVPVRLIESAGDLPLDQAAE